VMPRDIRNPMSDDLQLAPPDSNPTPTQQSGHSEDE